MAAARDGLDVAAPAWTPDASASCPWRAAPTAAADDSADGGTEEVPSVDDEVRSTSCNSDVPSVSSASTSTVSTLPPSDAASRSRQQRGGSLNTPPLAGVPWLQHMDKDQEHVPLSEELHCFADFVGLDEAERAERNLMRATLQQAAAQYWAHATAKVYGSFAYGLSRSESDLDVVVEGCAPYLAEHFPAFAASLGTAGYDLLGHVGGTTDVFLKAMNRRSGLTVNVTLTVGRSPARRAVALVKSALRACPAAAPVALVLRVVLRECSLTDVHSGGLSSYAITILVVHLVKTRFPEGVDAATLLRAFFQYYGGFDFRSTTIAIDGGEDGLRLHPDAPVSIADPLDAANNIADGCTKIAQVQAMLKYCGIAMQKWTDDGSAGDAEYVGRTPLSSIIAHKSMCRSGREKSCKQGAR